MFALLADLFLTAKLRDWRPPASVRGAILEHIRVTPRAIFVEGERIMADAGPLERVTGFFGADEAITSYRKGAPEWVATLIAIGDTRQRAEEKRTRVLAAIQRGFNLERIVDRSPENRL